MALNSQAEFERRHVFITGQISGITASGDEVDRLNDNGLDIYDGVAFKPSLKIGVQFTRNLSVAGLISYHEDSDQAIAAIQATEAELSFLNFEIEANYHLNGFNSFYLGLHAGFSSGEREELIGTTLISDEDTNGIFGVQFGYNLPLAERFAVGIQAKFSSTTFDDDNLIFSSLGFNGSFFF